MDTHDVNSKAEEYKKELMKLYGLRSDSCECSADDQKENIKEKEQENDTFHEEEQEICHDREQDDNIGQSGEHDTAYFPYNGDHDAQQPDTDITGESFQEPEMHSLMEPSSEEELGDSTGYILVNVRTGGEASPIIGASVMVTAVNEGKRFLIAVGTTDLSGSTVKLAVPAPDEKYSRVPDPERRPYTLFDITVRAKGFFDARSVDVPVFPGITSVQSFEMIPMPTGEKENGTVTYFNQEPYFG